MSVPLDTLVLDARLRQSLVAVRSLGRRGRRVGALDTVADSPTFRSRWCRNQFVCDAAEGSDHYICSLERVLDRSPARLLIPSHDATIAALRRHLARIERKARVAMAPEPAMAVAVNKERTLEIAARVGMRVPRGVAVTSVTQLPGAIREIGLPAVVKPTESWLSKGPVGSWIGPRLATTAVEARGAVADIERLNGTALLQTFLPGRREAVSFLYGNGRFHARFAQWAKRTRPPLGGESVLRQSIEVPRDIGSQAERLIREIGLEGYSEVEFRRDAAGVPYLMEINPRLSASVEIAVRSGVDFPHLISQWAIGDRIDSVDGYRTGLWMRFLQGDLMTTVAAFEERGRPGIPRPIDSAIAFGLSFLRPMAYDYFDSSDPLPAVKAMADFTRDVSRSTMRVLKRRIIGNPWSAREC